jgi:hypothetical protein
MINEHAVRNTALEMLNAKMGEYYKQLSNVTTDSPVREKLKISIETAQYFKDIIEAIIISGYPPLRTLPQDSNEQPLFDRRIAEIVQHLLDHREPLGTLLSGSNNVLIALITIACCGIGASLASIREDNDTPLFSTLTGFIVGFVVFLSLKGGKTIFLMNSSEVTNLVNPYSTALAALIVGMFTKRAYQILERFVAELVRRIEDAIKGGSRSK